MLTINLEWDSNALGAPQSFRNAIQTAAEIVEAAIYDPITVNIGVGYGEFDDGGSQYTPLTSGYSLGGTGSAPVVQLSYPALLAALEANETTATDAEALNSLPDATSLSGQSTFYISSALAKALGALPADDPSIDGYIGFPTSFSGNGLIAAGIVEILHAMGLLTSDGGVLSLFQYTSPGVHFVSTGATSTTPAYFSVDGGNTNLANYDVGFDDTLFSDLASDPLSIPNTGATTLTPLDLTEISAIGFDYTSTPILPTLSITPTTTSANVPASVVVQDLFVAENVAVPVLPLIKSVSVPLGDSISYYGFLDQGGGNGYFEFNGEIEPDNQWVYVLDTQLGMVRYVSGSSVGSEPLDVIAFDMTADTFSSTSQLIADTAANVATGAPGNITAPYAVALPASATYTASSANETILLGGGKSSVTLTSTATALYGDGGTDLITDKGGADTISLGSGTTTVTVTTGGTDILATSSSGSFIFSGGAKAATVHAGSGATTVFANAGGGQFFAGSATSLLFVGSTGASTIQGGGGGQLLFGGSSLDYIGGAGSATIIGGGTGNTVAGGTGNQLIFASSSLTYGGASGAATIIGGGRAMNVNLGSGGGVVYGSPNGGDTLQSGSGLSILVGGGSGDVLTASDAANDTLVAGSGAETLSGTGATGNLVLFGGSGNDTLVGGAGGNLFIAESGNETLLGGGSSDSYVFINTPGTARTDIISGFNPNVDAIGLFGYGSEPAADQAALASATITGGNTVVSLIDGTSIVFVGTPDLKSFNFF